MKYKVGDNVNVYGAVYGTQDNHFKAVCWFLHGLPAKIIEIVNFDEIKVQFNDKIMIGSRSLHNRILIVHVKQCRKLKVKK